MTEEEVRQIKGKYSAALLKQPGVCGVAVEKDDEGNFVLAVHLDPSEPSAGSAIPNVIEGVPVHRHESGPFKKL